MSPRYLLDTDTMSDLIRRPSGVVAGWIARVGEEAVCTSIVVSSELRFGAAKKASARLIGQLETVLSAIEIIRYCQVNGVRTRLSHDAGVGELLCRFLDARHLRPCIERVSTSNPILSDWYPMAAQVE